MLGRPSTAKIVTLHILTLGLYFFYYASCSRRDINDAAKQELVPNIWMLFLPGLNFFWMWQYAAALQQVSYGRIKSSDTFLLYVLTFAFWLSIPNFNLFYHLPRNPSVHTVLIVVTIVLALNWLLHALLLAAYCVIMQKRVNALQQTKAVATTV